MQLRDKEDRLPEGWRLLLAVCLAGAVGELVLYVGPLLLGVAVDGFGFSAGDAGYVVGVEFACSALAALIVSLRKEQNRLRQIAVVATGTLILCDGASFLITTKPVFIVCRVVAAFAAGVLFALANAVAARTANAQRTFSMMMFFAVLLSSLVYAVTPAAVGALGPRAALLVLVLVSAASLPAIGLLLPDTVASASDAPRESTPMSAPALMVLMAIAVLYCAQSGLWAYVERIGHDAGLRLDTIGLILTLNGAFSLLTALAGSALGLRAGLIWPIVLGCMLQVGAAVALTRVEGATGYGIAAIAFTVGLVFTVPFIKSVTAMIDRSGRIAGVATGAITLGAAAGPALAGLILNFGGNYPTISIVAGSGIIAAGVLAIAAIIVHNLTQRAADTANSQ